MSATSCSQCVGDPFDWLEATPALLIVPLVLTDVLPEWTLIIASVLSIPVILRLLVRLASAWEG